LIEVKGVSKNFGHVKAVQSVTFKVESGEAVSLLGSNGAGKSTLIKCILGLLDFSGQILVNGIDISKEAKKAKSLVGYVPQETEFYDMNTVDLLSFFASLRKVDKRRIDEVLNIVGLTEHAYKHTGELSGGMRQRLSFAVALLSDPEVLMLDEPTSNLDAQARVEFLNLVKAYKDKGKTVLFSSHRLDEVDILSDRVLFMKDGRVVVESGTKNLTKSLGLKIKMNILIPSTSLVSAESILSARGINTYSRNGAGLVLEVDSENKLLPVSTLIENNIPVTDITIIEPTMEDIIDKVDENGV